MYSPYIDFAIFKLEISNTHAISIQTKKKKKTNSINKFLNDWGIRFDHAKKFRHQCIRVGVISIVDIDNVTIPKYLGSENV